MSDTGKSYPRPCRACGTEIRLVIKNTVAGLKEPEHDEADCLYSKLTAREAENEKLRNGLAGLAAEWKAFRHTGFVPPEDGAAGQYTEEAMRDCAEALKNLLGGSDE